MKNIKKSIIVSLFLFISIFGIANATTIFNVQQGGTGVGTITGLIQGNGTSPFTVATPGTAYLVPCSALTTGSVLFSDSSGRPCQDTPNFFYSATNHRLGLGTNTPDNVLNVSQANGAGDVGIVIQNNATTTGETATLRFRTTTSTSDFGYVSVARQFNSVPGGTMILAGTDTANITRPTLYLVPGVNTSLVGIGQLNPTAKLDILDTTLAGSGSLAGSVLNLAQTWNTTGTPTAILLNVTNTASTGTPKLIDLQVGSVTKFNVSSTGLLTIASGINTGSTIISGASLAANSVSNIGWQTRSNMSSPADGKINLLNAATTVGVGLDFTTDGTLAIRNRAQTADGLLQDGGEKITGGIQLPYVAKTSAYTATVNDYEIDCTTGTFTVTLPNSTAGNTQIFVVTNSGTGVITVTTAGGTQIVGNDGLSTSKTLSAGASQTFHATGTGYRLN